MTKHEFLNQLHGLLHQLPEADRQRYVEFYAELIEDKIEDGMCETEAVQSLSDVQQIADEILRSTPLPVLMRTAVKPKRGWTVWSIILILLGLPIWLPVLAAVFVVCLTVYVVVWVVVLVLFLAVAVLWLAAVVCLIRMFFAGSIGGVMLVFGAALLLAGLGLLSGIGVVVIAKQLGKLTLLSFRSIKGMFIRKR